MERIEDLHWRKSSYSDNGGNCVEVGGTPSLVKVRDTTDRNGPELEFSVYAWRELVKQVKGRRSLVARWRKSSYSDNGGECIEIGGTPGLVKVRDTTDRSGPELNFSVPAWRMLVERLKGDVR